MKCNFLSISAKADNTQNICILNTKCHKENGEIMNQINKILNLVIIKEFFAKSLPQKWIIIKLQFKIKIYQTFVFRQKRDCQPRFPLKSVIGKHAFLQKYGKS